MGFDLFGIGPIADLAKKILDFFPNAEQRAQAAQHLEDLVAKVQEQQSATNTAEAATGNWFIAGWRPFLGWSGGIWVNYSILAQVFHLPPIDTTTIVSILIGMLGLGTMRTVEKVGGVATKTIRGFIR